MQSPNSCHAAAHKHDVTHIDIFGLARDLTNVWNILLRRHKVSEVETVELVVTTRNDRLPSAFDGNNMIGIIRATEIFQRLVEDLTVAAQFDGEHHERATVDIPPLAHPRHLQPIIDLLRGEDLRIDEDIDSEVLVELPDVFFHILCVVDLGHRLLCVEGMGEDTTVYVLVLVG